MDYKELEQANNFSSMLLSILAHDLRQPLAAVIMTADVLGYTQRELSREELNEIMGDLKDTATKSIELLDGLLSWLKSQRLGFEYQTQPLLLNDIVNEANGLFRLDQKSKYIGFNNTVHEKQVVYAHKQMLQFVIRNILSNATKYSPLGGIILISAKEDGNSITLAIKDQGYGMRTEREYQFTGIDQNDSQPVKSAGIAMAISQDMIALMKGKLWATSIKDSGTTFYLKLPMEG